MRSYDYPYSRREAYSNSHFVSGTYCEPNSRSRPVAHTTGYISARDHYNLTPSDSEVCFQLPGRKISFFS